MFEALERNLGVKKAAIVECEFGEHTSSSCHTICTQLALGQLTFAGTRVSQASTRSLILIFTRHQVTCDASWFNRAVHMSNAANPAFMLQQRPSA